MHKLVLLFLLIWGLTGCATYRTEAIRPQPVSLIKKISQKQPYSVKTPLPQDKASLSLADALTLALMHNPELAVFSYEKRIQEAKALQASLLPNPELDVEIENIAGSGSFKDVQGSELTLSIGQLIELGGKRAKRTKAAALGADVAAWDYEAARLGVFVRVVTEFTETLALQEGIALQNELVRVAESFLENINRRVEAGRVSPAETARARVELSTTQIELKRLQKELQSARKRLAATWGSQQPQFERVVGDLDTVYNLPELTQLYTLISQNPDIARWATEIQRRDAELALEKAQRVPDPVLSVGYRRLNESDDNAFVVGMSLPIKIFDRNSGNIQAAEYRKRQAEQQKRAVEIALQTRLAELYNELSAAYDEVTTLQTTVIPEAQKAFEQINQGYQMGRFGFLDVLDAQRSLFQVRSQYLSALKEYHQYVAQIERLIGQQLDQIR
ncbi:MAG: TolC family protein [Calditrichia bacterium]